MGEFGAILEVSKINLCDSVVSDTEDEEDDGEEDAGAADEETTKGGENRKPLHLHNSKSCGAFPTSIWDGAMTNNPTGTDNNTNDTNKDISPQNQRLRQQLANKVTRLSPQHRTAAVAAAAVASPAATNNPHRVLHRCRFAVKQIRKDLYPKKKIEAAKDLAREARLLSHLEHPNIIRLRATVGQPGDEDFMLMLDRLGTSLSEQVTQWQQQVDGTNGGALGIGFPWNLSSSSHRKGMERDILSDRLLALYDVARAMQYLHQKS
jgi:serine/threonine protein kinase